jgi:hypothetical protein
MDPEFVHDVAHTFNTHVGTEPADFLRVVPAVRFHMVEDNACGFAQRMHDGL